MATRKPATEKPGPKGSGATALSRRRGVVAQDTPRASMPSTRSLRLNTIVNPKDSIDRVLRQTLQVLADNHGILMQSFAPVRMVSGNLVFDRDRLERSGDAALQTMQMLARACVFYQRTATDSDRVDWHDEIRRLIRDAFEGPAIDLGRNTASKNSKAGFSSGQERQAARTPEWEQWQLLANAHWKKNSRLSGIAVAKLVAKAPGVTAGVEAIRKRIKKPGTQRGNT